MAITNYPNLRKQNGTIVDKATGKRYASPAQLAADLGISPERINWDAIAPESAPVASVAPTASSQTGYNPNAPLSGYNMPTNQSPVMEQPAPVISETTGNPVIDQIIEQVKNINDENSAAIIKLIEENQRMFKELNSKGQTINPNIVITEEQAAKWLADAQAEISPYYNNQMKLAREGLLRESGYTSDEIAQNEAQIEKKYGQSLRTLGGNMAESGFALSGQRQEGERTLAEDTQSGIDSARKTAEYNAGNSARQFASEWGGSNTPQYSYGAAPKVNVGQEKFSRSLDMKPFYSISDSVLNNLQGSQQQLEEAQIKGRKSEFESLYRTEKDNERKLANM